MGTIVLRLRVLQNETLPRNEAVCSQERILNVTLEELFISRRHMEVPYIRTSLRVSL
jgi:hypothetical protein